MNARVKEKYLISWLELLYLDSLVVPYFGSFFILLGIVVSLFPPFLKFCNLNFLFCSGHLEVHVPLFDDLEKLCVQVLWEGDKSSRRLADKASCQSAFCKPFGMPTKLH
jgi:hypothetical protein